MSAESQLGRHAGPNTTAKTEISWLLRWRGPEMPHVDAPPPLPVVIRCADRIVPRVRYVFDTLFMACGIFVEYVGAPPAHGAWVLYADGNDQSAPVERCVTIAHFPQAWRLFEGKGDIDSSGDAGGLATVFPDKRASLSEASDIAFDLVANAFYFLSSWSERSTLNRTESRQLYATSVFARFGVPQDIVDRYLERLRGALASLRGGLGASLGSGVAWPSATQFAVVLSHDVDFLPAGPLDTLFQGGKTILRHLIRQREPSDAIRAGVALGSALLARRDPYGCVPEIIAEELKRGVRSSFQVAVARRHPADVNYDIRDDRTRDYLRAITRAGFDLCLHGSYRSTESHSWYVEEAALLGERMQRPLGSRQHYLSFDYDTLFSAQEEVGIRYDMSMGFPDRCGPRAGFSYPYFPFCLAENRPYDVLEISLFFMDVTLRSYMGLQLKPARAIVESGLQDLLRKRGAVSVVWHPIVFGGARDPGYNDLYWHLVERVKTLGGLATDGRTIDAFWREKARRYVSFS